MDNLKSDFTGKIMACILMAVLLTACGVEEPDVPPFVGDNSITLLWTAPTTNTDLTPLDDLSGYYIYSKTGAGEFQKIGTIDNPVSRSYVVNGLNDGDYFFSVSAFNELGVESEVITSAIITLP